MQVPSQSVYSYALAYNGLSPRDESPVVHIGSPNSQISTDQFEVGGKSHCYTASPRASRDSGVSDSSETPPLSDFTSEGVDTSSEDEEYIEVLRKWPAAQRVFGESLEDPDFPNVHRAVQETSLSLEEWKQLRSFLIQHPFIVRHFWFDYDMPKHTITSGAPGTLHQIISPMIDKVVVRPVIQPWLQLFPLDHRHLEQIPGKMEVSFERLMVPDITVNLLFRPPGPSTNHNDFELLVVENAHFEKKEHVLLKTAKMMLRGPNHEGSLRMPAAEPEEPTGASSASQISTTSDDSSQLSALTSQTSTALDGSSQLSALTARTSALSRLPSLASSSGEGARERHVIIDAHGELSDLSSLTVSHESSNQAAVGYKYTTYVVVILEETPAIVTQARLPDTVNIKAQRWQELPLEDDCICGGWAYGGKVYVGQTRAYVMAFQGVDDAKLLMLRSGSFSMADW
ncbi:uncharacterized protein B0H18DRAFT_1132292, partial [Fomitopsis serialis]|uniref:uncharacterized protein n=1 Tax=Fomitopsis serialis TaxID=139415 RepID=UPI00200886E5